MTAKRHIGLLLAVCLAMASPTLAGSQPATTTRPFMQPVMPARSGTDAWFGLRLPGPVTDPVRGPIDAKPVLPSRPAQFGPGPLDPLLSGAAILADVQRIVGFSHASRAAGVPRPCPLMRW